MKHLKRFGIGAIGFIILALVIIVIDWAFGALNTSVGGTKEAPNLWLMGIFIALVCYAIGWMVENDFKAEFRGYHTAYFQLRQCGDLQPYNPGPDTSNIFKVKVTAFDDEDEEPSSFKLEFMRRRGIERATHMHDLKEPVQTRRVTAKGEPMEDWR